MRRAKLGLGGALDTGAGAAESLNDDFSARGEQLGLGRAENAIASLAFDGHPDHARLATDFGALATAERYELVAG